MSPKPRRGRLHIFCHRLPRRHQRGNLCRREAAGAARRVPTYFSSYLLFRFAPVADTIPFSTRRRMTSRSVRSGIPRAPDMLGTVESPPSDRYAQTARSFSDSTPHARARTLEGVLTDSASVASRLSIESADCRRVAGNASRAHLSTRDPYVWRESRHRDMSRCRDLSAMHHLPRTTLQRVPRPRPLRSTSPLSSSSLRIRWA